MRRSWLIVLLLLGCSRVPVPESNAAESGGAVESGRAVDSEHTASSEQLARADQEQPTDPGPAAPGCVVHATIPSQARVGSYPSIDVRVTPAIQFHGGPNPPRMIIELTKPDGELETTRVELLYPPVCAYCLPAKGSGGCDHSCQWEPYTGDRYGIGRHLKTAGEYRITLKLENYACALEGREGVLVVGPKS